MMEVSTPLGSTPDLRSTPAKPKAELDSPSPFQPLAEKFEAAFLAEMLKHTGLGKSDGAFSGGPGAQAFKSFLIEIYAQDLAKSSSIGIADAVATSLSEKEANQ